MNNLYRELAPVSDAAWASIEDEARRTFLRNLAGRRVVDVVGPAGLELAAVGTGHVRPLDASAEGVIVRQRLAQLLIESEVLRLNAYRGLSAIMRSGVPGPEDSLGKWHWSEVNQSLTEVAMEIAGPRAMLSDSDSN